MLPVQSSAALLRCNPQSSLCSSCNCSRSTAALWCGLSRALASSHWAGVHTKAVTASWVGSCQVRPLPTASGADTLSLTAAHCPPPSCGTIPLGSQGLCVVSVCMGVVSCGRMATIRNRAALGCHLSKHQQWPPPPYSGFALGPGCLLNPKVKSFPWPWLPPIQCCAMTWSEQGQSVHLAWTGLFGKAIMGNSAATKADVSLPCPGGLPACTCSSQMESRPV